MDYLQMLKTLGIECVWVNTKEKCGAYLDGLNLVYLSNNMTETELENFVIHETWHVMSKDFLTKLSAPQLKMVQEAKANKYLLHRRCEEWLEAFDNQPEDININHFLEYFQLSPNFYDVAEQEFKRLLAC